jgi:hypothetical protein
VKSTLTNRSITHIGHAKIFGLIIFFRESETSTQWNLCTNNTMSAKEIVLFIKDVHGATFSF